MENGKRRTEIRGEREREGRDGDGKIERGGKRRERNREKKTEKRDRERKRRETRGEETSTYVVLYHLANTE